MNGILKFIKQKKTKQFNFFLIVSETIDRAPP